MLARMNMEFEGTPHSGLDDARNIARVVVRLLRDGASFRINERLCKENEGIGMTHIHYISLGNVVYTVHCTSYHLY